MNILKQPLKNCKSIKKAGNKVTIDKISKIVLELENHPFEGIGNPEALKHKLSGLWSRRINSKDRLIYEVKENIVTVEVLSAMGHYSGK